MPRQRAPRAAADVFLTVQQSLNAAPPNPVGALTRLFCETLNWGNPAGLAQVAIPLEKGASVTAAPVAQLGGVPVFAVAWAGAQSPNQSLRRAVRGQLTKTYAEHLAVHIADNGRRFAFVWAHRRPDGKSELRALTYVAGTPARTAVERLAKLGFTLAELGSAGGPSAADVLARLEDAFSVEQVTRQFYREIADWYFWASSHPQVKLPSGVATDADRALFFIRLLARVMFCWFLRHKLRPDGRPLLPDDLFTPDGAQSLLKDAGPEAGGYYPAVLQNLFFATLNTEMDADGEPPKRRFVVADARRGYSDDHMVHTLWRNADLLKDPEALAALLRRAPFLNGGLFECLDDRVTESDGSAREIRLDGFSNQPAKRPHLPNELFFGDERTVDLSAAYGDEKRKRATVRPLMTILARYNFTLTENTPFEQEIALDPELLGHVFENLLAAYNPETGAAARKQTGSFYTPRVVVDWMADQSLLLYFQPTLDACAERAPTDDGAPDPRLAQLLSWDADPPKFSPAEADALVAAVERLKVLDPACGSGAFLMGLLQKLVHVLRRLDPDNRRWRARQEAAARQMPSPEAREAALEAIERAFARNNDDYGRKLYLIENCLYGVDIQPIACQLAKLRFFIALIIEQDVDPKLPNDGLLPLPNLETKIVAANTLLPLAAAGQMQLRDERLTALETELQQVRREYVTARRYRDKKALRERDRRLCRELTGLLQEGGALTSVETERLTQWNPYAAQQAAPFFDPAWMFGLSAAEANQDGVFDLVIGNPPYVRQEQLASVTVPGPDGSSQPLKDALKAAYACYVGTADLYVYFFERGLQLLKTGGVLAFITSNKYLRAGYGERLRTALAAATRPAAMLDFGDAPVFEAIAYPCIFIARKTRALDRRTPIKSDAPPPEPAGASFRALTWDAAEASPVADFPAVFAQRARAVAVRDLRPDGWRLEDRAALDLLDKLRRAGRPLGEVVQGKFYYGIKTGLNEAFVVDRATRDRLIAEHPSSAEVLKPFLRGRDVKRWRCTYQDLWLIFIPWHFPLHNDPLIKGASSKAETQFIKEYPAIYKYLNQFRPKLECRNKVETGIRYEWYTLQRWGSEYCKEFTKSKIIIPAITNNVNYALDFDGHFTNDKTSICLSDELKLLFLLGLLNSSLLWWYIKKIAASREGGFYELKPVYVTSIPIVETTSTQEDELRDVVSKILASKSENNYFDASSLEKQINALVYQMYGLTENEIALVEA